jgi:uncharacterized membrane protein
VPGSRHRPGVNSPRRVFLWLAGGAGLAFSLLTPPLQVPDENRHLNRSYMISRGDLRATRRAELVGNPIPWSLLSMRHRLAREGTSVAERWRAEFGVALQPEAQVFTGIPSLYSPLPYLPQAAAIALLAAFEPPPIVLCYAARLANLAVWIALIHAALGIAASHRWSLALLALTPMSLFMAASSSADVVTNGLAFLWVAVVFRRRADAAPLSARDAVGVWMLASALGLCKPVYWVLAALLFTWPSSIFGGSRRRIGVLLAILGGSLLPALVWFGMTSHFEGPNPVFADPAAQTALLLSDPAVFASVLLESVRIEALRWLQQFVGVLGWLDTPLPGLVYGVIPVVLCGVALSEAEPPGGIGWRVRSLLLAIPLGCWLVVMLYAFVNWTAPGEGAVRSFQGRYLIPLAPLLGMALQRRGSAGVPLWAARTAVVASASCLGIALVAVVRRYYF